MWQENQSKSVKRSLSVFEKSFLDKDAFVAPRFALIFPGEPHTEAEELNDAGFSLSNIFGIEKDYKKAEVLLDFYYDTVRIFCDDMGTFLDKCHHKFSYAHLDYCSPFTPTVAEDIIKLGRKSTDSCFLRTTVFYSRRSQTQKEYEETFWQQIYLLFNSIDIDISEHDLEWPNLLAMYCWLVKSHQGLYTLQDFFNLRCLNKHDLRFFADNPYIYTYKEAEANNQMATVFMKYTRSVYSLNESEIRDIVSQLSQKIPYYIKPEPGNV